MKRLWISLGVLVLLFAISLGHSAYLKATVTQMTDRLEAAQELAQNEEWEGATTLTQEAHQLWIEQDNYLHAFLRHSDTDEITESYQGMEELLACQDFSQYAAANARLLSQLYLLWEAEALSVKNVL